jgi:hypothetical protein
MITLGLFAVVMGLIRILAFKIPESPRFLLSKGRDVDAVEAVNYIARYNGKQETLTIDMLQAIDAQFAQASGAGIAAAQSSKGLTKMQLLKESLTDYESSNFKKLFKGRGMAQHTSVTFLIWLTLGIGYPLYFAFITSYLQTKKSYSAGSGLSHTYTIYCIVSAVGVLGPIAAGFCVETRMGRRWMMAISAILTGVFLFLYTLAQTEVADIGFQCATGILGNFGKAPCISETFLHTNCSSEYAIMFAFTPESFPGPIRGTGTGVAATLLRFGGLVASFISTFSGYTVVPIYASAALWILTGILCFALPYETHGHASI